MKYTVNKKQEAEGFSSKLPQYLCAAAVSIGGFSMGNVLGWSSPALPKIVSSGDFPDITLSDESWIGSLITVGASIAALLAGISVEKFGRKSTMLISSFFFLIGWLCIGSAQQVYVLYAGRFLTGVGVGALSLSAPVFLTEISESEVRGMIGVAFQLMVVLGMLFSTVIGYLTSWRWLSIICCIVPVIFALSVTWIPESPRFLLRKGKVIEASKALSWLRCSDYLNPSTKVSEELENIQENVDSCKENAFTLNALLLPSVFKPILLTVGLLLFNQVCGISAINFYSVQIFKHAATSLDPYLSTIIVGIVQVMAVFLSSALVDRAGRRVFLIFSFILMTISLVSLGVYFHLKASSGEFNPSYANLLSYLPILSVIVFNVGYSLGIGSLVWTVMSELLPSNIIGPVYAFETSYNWLLAFVISRYFHVVNEILGIQNTFWIFSIFTVFGMLFVIFAIPETKNKTLEQIQEELNTKKKLTESKSDLVSV